MSINHANGWFSENSSNALLGLFWSLKLFKVLRNEEEIVVLFTKLHCSLHCPSRGVGKVQASAT